MNLFKIVQTRFKKDKEQEFVFTRRKECKKCPFNSLNSKTIPLHKKLLISASNILSWLTFNSKKDNLGNCLACEACSIYYKTKEKEEKCPKKLWK